MNEAKIDVELQLSLGLNEEERARSLDLDVGYDRIENEWELIIKYSGDLLMIQEELGITVTPLLGEYAIVLIRESLIDRLSEYPQIEFIEKPKALQLSEMEGIAASCINQVRIPPFSLYGTGMLAAVIDTGIDYAHPDFRNEDGTTRIVELWDQSGRNVNSLVGGFENSETGRPAASGEVRPIASEDGGLAGTTEGRLLGSFAGTLANPMEGGFTDLETGGDIASEAGIPSLRQPPPGYNLGILYSREQINQALRANSVTERLSLVPEVDLSGHGTHVTGILAGNGKASEGRYIGVAPEAELLIVKLGPGSEKGFPRTSELMQAIDFCVRYGIEQQRPIAINISYGNNYGDHVGTSLLEQYINRVANLGRTSICIGAGNEGNTGRHYAGRIEPGRQEIIEFAVAPFETGLNLQIWKEYADVFRVNIQSPSGGIVNLGEGPPDRVSLQTDVKLLYAEPTPYDTRQEIYIALIPRNEYIDEGIWRLILEPIQIRSGYYNVWLPVSGATSASTGFFSPTPELTLTIPSTAYRAITVGAYDSRTDSYAAFSGRGFSGEQLGSGSYGDIRGPTGVFSQKPDLVAPGVNIHAASPGGGYDTRSGTSMATPFVTGAAVLLMQWGIQEGNDIYLYGEKLKAALIRGSRPLPGFREYPNAQVGWGALCVRSSFS